MHQPYWPVQVHSPDAQNPKRNRSRFQWLQWDINPLRWNEYPFRPHVLGCDVSLEYAGEMPRTYPSASLYRVPPYTRADFWNLLPWVGPPLVWGQGIISGMQVRQDCPPYYHECTLTRDFIPFWSPTRGVDQMGRCGVMVPMVCAYCWGHTWRRCDSIPRVGAYGTPAARLSPVLEACVKCGQTSDYSIIRHILDGDFDSLIAIVVQGAATMNDVIRCTDACVRVGSPPTIRVPESLAPPCSALPMGYQTSKGCSRESCHHFGQI